MCTVHRTYEKLTRSCTERTYLNHIASQPNSGMHKNKGTGQVWSFNGEVCRIESQKATECVQFIEHMKSSPSHVQNAPQPCRQSTKLRNINIIISMKTKVMVKFGASMVMCVELTTECVQFIEHVKSSTSHVQNAPQPHCQSTKLRNMIISMKTKVLVKFGASMVKCVELSQKATERVQFIEHVKSSP